MLYHVWQEEQNLNGPHSFGEFSSRHVKRLMQALAHLFCFCPKQRPRQTFPNI